MADVIFTDDDGRLIALQLDATPEEIHRASAHATENEVERGVAVVDHVRPERRVLTLNVVISDTPLDAGDRELTRTRDVWAQLIDARDRALLAQITTRLETYEDMVLVEAETTRTSADGTWIRAQLTFAEIRRVSTELVDDPTPTRPRDRSQENLGPQATEDASERQESFAHRGLRDLGNAFPGVFGGG